MVYYKGKPTKWNSGKCSSPSPQQNHHMWFEVSKLTESLYTNTHTRIVLKYVILKKSIIITINNTNQEMAIDFFKQNIAS
jgi:hypothetical protein